MSLYKPTTSGWPEAAEIKSAIEARQLTRPVTLVSLRALVRQGRWADIGNMFDFEPLYSAIAGKLYFNWTCCTPEFWAAYQPHKYARGKTAPKKTMFQSKRLATKPHPTAKMLTFQSQGGICYYCEQPTGIRKWSIDHKTPLCRGGSNLSDNKVGACKTCNHAKACLTEGEYRNTPEGARKDLIRLRFAELGKRDGNRVPSQYESRLMGGAGAAAT